MQFASGVFGWIWPGLGHWKNGEADRGRRIMLGVLGLFLLGLLAGGLDCVDRRDDYLWFIAQAGNGPIAFVADAANNFFLKQGQVGVMLPLSLPGGGTAEINSFKSVGFVNEVGTLFIAMGGLMNVVALLDAMRGPRKVAR